MKRRKLKIFPVSRNEGSERCSDGGLEEDSEEMAAVKNSIGGGLEEEGDGTFGGARCDQDGEGETIEGKVTETEGEAEEGWRKGRKVKLQNTKIEEDDEEEEEDEGVKEEENEDDEEGERARSCMGKRVRCELDFRSYLKTIRFYSPPFQKKTPKHSHSGQTHLLNIPLKVCANHSLASISQIAALEPP